MTASSPDPFQEPARPTRKGITPIKVYCLPDELASIKANAVVAGLTASTYLRRLGLGFEPRSILDHQYVEKLSKINADQSRLGNLLKMWLADDARLQRFDSNQMTATIELALERIKGCQVALLDAARKV